MTSSWQQEVTSPTPTTNAITSISKNLDFITRLKQHRLYKILSARRPWRVYNDRNKLCRPQNLSDLISRFKTNFSYFYINYAIAIFVVIILFVSYNNPFSWAIFYIVFKDEPPLFNSQPINVPITLAILAVLSVLSTYLVFGWIETIIVRNFYVGLVLGVIVVLIHLVFRKSDDLHLNENEAIEAGLVASSTFVHDYGGHSTPSAGSKLLSLVTN